MRGAVKIKLSNRLLKKSLYVDLLLNCYEASTSHWFNKFKSITKLKIKHNFNFGEMPFINLPKCINKQNRQSIAFRMPINLMIKYEL